MAEPQGGGTAAFEWTVREVGGVCTITLIGEFDLAAREAIEGKIPPVGSGPVVVDMQRLEFIDSTGLRFLIALKQSTADNEAPLTLRGITEPVQRVLDVSGLTDFFDYAN